MLSAGKKNSVVEEYPGMLANHPRGTTEQREGPHYHTFLSTKLAVAATTAARNSDSTRVKESDTERPVTGPPPSAKLNTLNTTTRLPSQGAQQYDMYTFLPGPPTRPATAVT